MAEVRSAAGRGENALQPVVAHRIRAQADRPSMTGYQVDAAAPARDVSGPQRTGRSLKPAFTAWA